MVLAERKKEILKETISEYIRTAEPVGSKVLTQKPSLNVSSATIRNELSELEKDGYLTHLHTSSGRVPTDKGYRTYVDSLMTVSPMTPIQIEQMESALSLASQNVHEVLSTLTQVMASSMDYTAIILTPDIYQDTLKMVHLISVGINQILVVLLNSLGVNKDFLVTLDESISQDDLNKLSQFLTQKLGGKQFVLTPELLNALNQELPVYQNLLFSIQKEIHRLLQHRNQLGTTVTKGSANMLKLPEFSNIELARKVVTALEENRIMASLLSRYISTQQTVAIGKEIEHQLLDDCSLVTATYSHQDTPMGVIGILGPKRMPYATVVSMVKNFSEKISDFISKKSKS